MKTNIETKSGHRQERREAFRWKNSAKYLCMLLVFLFSANNTYAKYNEWAFSTHAAVSWDCDNARVKIDIMYWDDNGSSTSDYNAGYAPGDGHLTLSFGNGGTKTKLYITCDSGGNDLKVVTKEDGGDNYSRGSNYTTNNDGQKRWLVIYWNLKESDLNRSHGVSFEGMWWRRGVGSTDYQVRHTENVTCNATIRDITFDKYEFTNSGTTPIVRVYWTKSGTGANCADTKGSMYLKKGSTTGSNLANKTTAASGSFDLTATDANAIDLNKVNQYVFHQWAEVGNNSPKAVYSKFSSVFSVPAYPQVKTLGATFNSSTRKIDVAWTIDNTVSSSYTNDNFVLKITPPNGSAEEKTIAFVQGQGEYNYSYEVPTGLENANYNFEINRSTTKDNTAWVNTYKKTASTTVSTKHCNISNPQAVLASNNQSAEITWTKVSGVWSSGTKLIIKKWNKTEGGEAIIIELNETEFNSGEYTDNLIKNCNEYEYSLQIVPNTSYMATPAIIIANTITPTEIGDVVSLTASKGYFSNRVELIWECNGAFDNFAVNRKEYGEPDSAYRQIFSVEGSNVQTQYIAQDENQVPGIVYVYQVVGAVNCANNIVSSNTRPSDIGFRTPTGDIYGRVTFENGQAVEGVEVFVETLDVIKGKSYQFDGSGKLTINNTAFMSANNGAITLQAWIKPDATSARQSILKKADMYELFIEGGKAKFKVGASTLTADIDLSDKIGTNGFVHLSGVYTGNSALIYLNGQPAGEMAHTASVPSNSNAVVIGEAFKGIVDEVRVWSVPLTGAAILADYNRYLTGSENDLIAYYTFNYTTTDNFYDLSYVGTKFNENHGTVSATGVSLVEITPNNDQLGYRGITAADGSYSIRAIPYIGNGSAYNIIPRFGDKTPHKFESTEELRFIGPSSPTFTVNFIDKSSFDLYGYVTYKGGTMPVEGVSFKIDGRTAISGNGTVLMTNAAGYYTISVPVGQHEVVAEKLNHVFENGGRVTDSNLNDRNYQDEQQADLIDITTIRYIGRVAGGAVEEAYPIGHSVSTNNLAEGIDIKLTPTKIGYKVASTETPIDVDHFKPSNKSKAKSNEVVYGEDFITVYPNEETGEFVVDVIPERFTVNVTIPGHTATIIGNNEEVNFSDNFEVKSEIYSYIDSTWTGTEMDYQSYIDTVYYNKAQKFILRYAPTIRITQLDNRLQELPYFGSDSIEVATLVANKSEKAPLYNSLTGGYTLNYPAFEQGKTVYLKTKVFEEYKFYDKAGTEVTGKKDEVPTTDAVVKFGGSLIGSALKDLSVNEKGEVIDTVLIGGPELTDGLQLLSATATYGDSEPKTSINWPNSFRSIVLGGVQKGVDFITNGPDKLLFVLRDPPGSKSSAYLEKGTSVTESSTYHWNVNQAGEELLTTKFGTKVVTFTGVGAGVIKEDEFHNEFGWGVKHEEKVNGVKGTEKKVTTTTRFQTSDDPLYVGANGDLFVGYSTNISFGSTDNVNVISKKNYNDLSGDGYTVYESVTPLATSNWLLVKETGLGLAQNFATLFAYPQIHIEEVLIPGMVAFRNNILRQSVNGIDYQAEANTSGNPVYVSKLTPDHKNYGRSNSDTTVFAKRTGNNIYDGESYKVYFPTGWTGSETDTIMSLNQSINNWYKHLENNEEAKVKAKLKQNYSFHAASPIQYSEQYSHMEKKTVDFEFTVGPQFAGKAGVTVLGTGFIMEIKESVTTGHGNEYNDQYEGSVAKGFTLAEEGDDDYLSVDVCVESGYKEGDDYVNFDDINDTEHQFSTFIFKTRAGATSCPYEKGYIAKYYEPEKKHLIDEPTIQVEVPSIDVENNFIENVPSGKPAQFKLYLRNNSELNEDGWYVLKVLDSSNPNGAKFTMDGAAIGNGRNILIPAEGTLIKTLEVAKGAVMNYDGLQIALQSICQCDPTDFLDNIADTLSISVHFTPSCTDVNVKLPGNNWTYNTMLPTIENADGTKDHYLNVALDGFDVNYDNFQRIKLQYKPASGSEYDWVTLMNYYNNQAYYDQAIANGSNAEMINPADAGTIRYQWMMDDLPDQRYDLRAVSICLINNIEYETESDVKTGIKDMYKPRLFGSAQPANGILTINDDIRLNFNEPIAEGYLTNNNFTVTGIRNGAQTDHSVSVQLDGINDALKSEFDRNWSNKDISVEMWVLANKAQNATYFSHGNTNNSLELSITNNNLLKVRVGKNEYTSQKAVPFEAGSWSHVALVFEKEGYVTAYYNYEKYITQVETSVYTGIGNCVFGKSIASGANYFEGKMHNARIWDKVLTAGRITTNSLDLLSGTENGLMAYYPMNEAKGTVLLDKARGSNLVMNGGEWSLPEGRSAQFNGNQYLKLNTSLAVIDQTMDSSIEFWFKADASQKDATMVSNGLGDGNDRYGSKNLISIGFENGLITFYNNEVKAVADGDYLDNNWHHFALSVNRNSGRAQIIIDGKLNKYFESTDLGGVASTFMYLGVKSWTENEHPYNEKYANYFNGFIDEFRIWNLYRSESIVSQNNNERLAGDEKGLIAYYPFDYYITWQGTKELNFTVADQKIQKDETIVVPDAVISTGKIESSSIAPIKDRGPVTNLKHNFVVNNDALIINMDEDMERIEKTIVTFTVDGVRDLNGNAIASPITWSAYIDRNQLKWSESELDIEKAVYEPLEFTVAAINHGGFIQHFNIENMPTWMDVEPSSGTINPSSSIKITFTIDEGLNVGLYDEVVYLHNDNNVSEALPIRVKVNGEKPNWSVNPADFQYSMSVFGKMRIDNIFSNDKEDMLAAFENGKCIGVANSSYNKEHDMWYTFLTVYNNKKETDNIEFRMWDASTGKVYSATTEIPFIFKNESVFGTAKEPVIFDGSEIFYQNLGLNAGWNWISFNLANSNMSNVDLTLQNGEWNKKSSVKGADYFADYSENNKKWSGTLTTNDGFKNTSMYKLFSEKDQLLSASGTAINVKTMPITVNGNRWNYISFLPNTNFTVKEALAGYEAVEGDIIKSQTQFAMYSGSGWIGNLNYMNANKGYMLYRAGSDTINFVYPSISGSLSNNSRSLLTDGAPIEQGFVNNNYAENMNIIATGSSGIVQPGDKIVASVNGEKRGVGEAVPFGESEIHFITISGSEAGDVKVSFDLQRGNEIIARSSTAIDYRSNTMQGSPESPIVLNFSGGESNARLYPNPFTDLLSIDVSVSQGDEVRISIYDALGRLVTTLPAATSENDGAYHAAWNGQTAGNLSCPAGIYLVHITINGGEVSVYKVEKK